MTGFELAILLALLGGTAATVGGQVWANKKNQQLNSQRFLDSTELANTAHQREVYDLRMAGLNPILSTGTAGAAVPNVASAEVSNPLANLDNVGKGIGNFMNNSATTRAQVGLNTSLASLNAQRSEALQGDIAIQNTIKDALGDKAVKEALRDELILRGAPESMREAAYLDRKKAEIARSKGEKYNSDGWAKPKTSTFEDIKSGAKKAFNKLKSYKRDDSRSGSGLSEKEKEERAKKAAVDDKKAREKQKTSKVYKHRMRGY